MRPRVILRTHYQADEPRLIIAAAIECASPTESRHEENIASALVRWAREKGRIISIPGATYAVGNARSMGLLNASYRWTATGLAFAFLRGREHADVDVRTMSRSEQRLFLRQYLIFGGALVIEFGRWLLSHQQASDDIMRDEAVLEKLLVKIMEDYLSLATEIPARTSIRRERDRLRRTDYGAATKRHKRYPLLATMERLRLIESMERGGIRPDSTNRLATLVTAIPDVTTLERLVRESAIERVLDALPDPDGSASLPSVQRPSGLLISAYRYALDLGLQACPIEFLHDVFFACLPQGTESRVEPDELLDRVHKSFPGHVRFHVDRRGRRAFVLLDEDAEERLRVAV